MLYGISQRQVVVIAFTIASFISFVPAIRADDPPAWLRQASSVKLPAYEKDVPAAAILDEESVSLNNDGKIVTTENFAVKILTREGRDYAVAKARYLVSTGKVKEMLAWIIRPDGTTKSYEKKNILDLISDPDDVYNEGRIKIIDASGDVDVGYVFGYILVTEEPPLFYQDSWVFQGPIPVVESRFSLNLPAGWSANSLTFNAPEITPRVNGGSYTWEMRDQPRIADEPMSPASVNLAARIVVNYVPDKPDKASNRVFSNWLDVSRWATPLYEPQMIVDDNIAAKARELTANTTTELEKIRAIGVYVQNLQYISIDIGVGYGNGYIPRSSPTVLGRGYGDCKDKANLMRALLKALKIDAYPVVIFSGDPTFVREQWPSPKQFNHCIIAVKVGEATQTPTIITNAKLGRLLIFDATDPYTPVGDLPYNLQGSFALLIAGESGGLDRMPVTPPDTDVLQRTINVDLSSQGELRGTIRERANGQASAYFRREFRSLSASEYRKVIEGWLTRGATGASLGEITSNDGKLGATFDLDVVFSAARYGQIMQGRLLVFKPVIVGRRNAVSLTDNKRTNPIEIHSTALNETAIFTLPDGFAVDEIPAGATIEATFGKYVSKYEVRENKLYFSRSMTLNRAVLPADKYSAARDFFAKVRDAEQSQVVLIKK